MKRMFVSITVLIVLFVLVQFKIQISTISDIEAPFVLMLIAVVWSAVSGGFLMGIGVLLSTILFASYFFLTPYNLFLIDIVDMQQIALFTIEGLALIIIINILKQANEREHSIREQFQVILSSIGEAVIATDRKGNIEYMNARSQKLFGLKFHNAKNKHLSKVLPITERIHIEDINDSLNKVLLQGKNIAISTPITIHTSDQDERVLQYSLAPLRDMKAKNIGVVVIFRDVSEHKNMEVQREVLLGSISHELKNHMTSLQGYAHILQKRLENDKKVDLITLTDKLNGKIQIMSSMITSMLDLSKIKMGKLDMNLVDFDLEELVKTTIQDQEVSNKCSIVISGSLSHLVHGDKIRIGQVLTNLLSNAVKYSPGDREIIVTLKEHGTHAHVSVKDHGPGIDQSKISKIFQPFYRAGNDRDRSSISGSGLGLYISREIIKQNGGEIFVKSKPNKGSQFTFTVPLTDLIEPQINREPEMGIIERIRDVLRIEYNFRK